jgi:hypothetical protein
VERGAEGGYLARRYGGGYIVIAMPALKQYDAKLDAKHRIRIHGTRAKKFVVTHDKNGNIILQPRRNGTVKQLVVISTRTLKMMDRAMRNFSNGKVSAPVNFDSSTV